jgi:hypothetical protein
MKHLAVTIALLAAACGGKEDEQKKEAPKAGETKPGEAKADEEKPEPKPAPVDPATFVDVDLSSVPVLAGLAVKAPPGATVTADPPGFGEDAAQGAVIAQGGFALHLWRSTIGGERTVLPMKADMEGSGKYVETKCEPGSGLCEYVIEKGAAKTFGFFRSIDGMGSEQLNDVHGQLLCGPAREVATADELAPYRAACDTVKKK